MTLVCLPCLSGLAVLGLSFPISPICFSQVTCVFQSERIPFIIFGREWPVGAIFVSFRKTNNNRNKLRGCCYPVEREGEERGTYFEAAGPSWQPRNHATPLGAHWSPCLKASPAWPVLSGLLHHLEEKLRAGLQVLAPEGAADTEVPAEAAPAVVGGGGRGVVSNRSESLLGRLCSLTQLGTGLLTGSQQPAERRVCMKLPDLETTGCFLSFCL